MPAGLAELESRVVSCRRCPRLVEWRESVARTKRAAFTDQTYWGRPVPGFGDAAAQVVIVGLAPAAHGGNRTGRIFTGDRSGDFLFAALHRTGLANQSASVARDDGLELRGCYVTAVVRCAPPSNRPATTERDACLGYLVEELELLADARCVVALGAFAWDGALRALGVKRRPRFAHAAEYDADGRTVLACYHVSQQNTFTGRLTERMLDDVLRRALSIVRQRARA